MQGITLKQLNRYPEYLKILKILKKEGNEIFQSKVIAQILDCSEEQVRKDIQAISKRNGKPGVGRKIDDVIDEIEEFLGVRSVDDVIVVGTGRLGQAFMSFGGFEEHGLNILAGFDNNPGLIDSEINGKKIFSIDRIENLAPRLNVHLAILCTPKSVAQVVADKLVNSGIKGIFNFTGVLLNVPEDVIVENVDLASSLLVLAHRLKF